MIKIGIRINFQNLTGINENKSINHFSFCRKITKISSKTVKVEATENVQKNGNKMLLLPK